MGFGSVGKSLKRIAKKVGHFTPPGQAYKFATGFGKSLKSVAKKVGGAVEGAAKKFGHFTPHGQAYQIFRGAKEGGLKGAIGNINLFRALSGDPTLFGKKNKGMSVQTEDPGAMRATAARKLIRRPYKGQAGAGQIEYTMEYDE